jgi:predicted nucleotide-binding protein
MAQRSTTSSQSAEPPLELAMSIDEAKARLQERIEKGRALRQRRVESGDAFEVLSNDYSKWDSFNSALLKRVFTTDEMTEEYDYCSTIVVSYYGSPLSERIADLQRDLDRKIHRIDSINERLEIVPLSTSLPPEVCSQQHCITQPRTGKVSVVHGRDEVAKTSLEVFLHELGLDPVVLHRQPDQGMTVIEKLEKHSDVGYAFILLTPDEVAYLASEEAKPDAERKKEHRARPNVIFEFGYFLGKLGRSRVCCLYTGDVALPSDVSGMIYKHYEKSIEEVAFSVIKDLKASGYEIA